MTANGWLQIAALLGRAAAVTKPLGLYLGPRLRRLDAAGSRPVERVLYRLAGVDPDEDQHWTRYAGRDAAVQRGVDAADVRRAAAAAPAAAQSRRTWPRSPTARRSRPRPRSRPTRTGSRTSGESTMSYFSQMTQLAFHNFTSAAAGMALAVALVRGHRAALRRPARQLLGRSGPRHALRPAAALASCSRCSSCSRA